MYSESDITVCVCVCVFIHVICVKFLDPVAV